MNTTVLFDKIETKLGPKQYLKQLEKLNIEELKKTVLPGEYVQFTKPAENTVTFTFLGEKPEKFEVGEEKILVLMTKCVLFLVFKEDKDDRVTTVMEVASAF